MGKIYEIVRPKSLTNSDYEAFEYLIRWIGRDGADYQYMFYDAELSNSIKNEIINDTGNVEAVISAINKKITLTATDLSKTDLLVIGELLENKFVTRLLKDETIERYAPDANSFKYRLMDGRYSIEFDLIPAQQKAFR
jgi:hypothetical protein